VKATDDRLDRNSGKFTGNRIHHIKQAIVGTPGKNDQFIIFFNRPYKKGIVDVLERCGIQLQSKRHRPAETISAGRLIFVVREKLCLDKSGSEREFPLQVHGAGNPFGFVDGDDVVFAKVDQMLIHGLHVILGSPFFNVLGDLVETAFADAGLDGGCRAHDFDDRQDVLARLVLDEP